MRRLPLAGNQQRFPPRGPLRKAVAHENLPHPPQRHLEAAGRRLLTFHLEHCIYADGKPVSQIEAEQAGKVTGGPFTSSGISGRYDLSGNLQETFSVTISGTRVTE
ncbi:hypothetical protein [Streptomyces sp. NPDC051162]|uniref:hypothetical protein n=1 Tax=unclassified Streptomyces TaxID=2593676 RepID=UPI0034406185